MSTASSSTRDQRLRARYGEGRTGGRRMRLILALIAGAVLVTGAVVVGLAFADQPVRTQAVAYEHASSGGIELSFQVTMRPGTRARCAVQALDASRGQVGFREVVVGPETSSASIQHVEIATQGPPVSAEVMHCEPI